MHIYRHKVRTIFSMLFICIGNDIFAETHFNLFPKNNIYPLYVADPLKATSSFQYMYFAKTTINDTSKQRFDIKLGGTFLLGEWISPDDTASPFQLVLDGGFHGQFDVKQNQDNIGWDGIYGFRLFYRPNNNIAFTAGIKHISAHIGDELQERTGRIRINYTREEFIAGLAWSYKNNTDIYFETARAYDIRNKTLQAPWRLQTGIQYRKNNTFWDNKFGWYTALDFSAFEENNWSKNITLQTGLYTRENENTWRIGVELYDGRAQLGEFFQDKERYISIGLWYDL